MGAVRRRPSGLQNALQDLSGGLIIFESKMRSIVQSMADYLSHREHQDPYLDGLASVLQDLVDELEDFGSQADRMSWAKTGKGPSIAPSATAAAA